MDFKHLTQFKDIIELDKRPVKLDERETFNVSWGIDENYQVGAAISIASILENNKQNKFGNDSNLLIVFYVQIMPDDFVMQLHRF